MSGKYLTIISIKGKKKMVDYSMSHKNYERVWKVEYINNERFSYPLFIRGTEAEMHDYLESEMGYVGRYHALSPLEIKAIEDLQLKIYLAPRSKN